MASPGYSGKPVWQKLGIDPSKRIRLIGAPEDYVRLIDWPDALPVVKSGRADLVHCFVTSKDSLKSLFPMLIEEVTDGGCIWISWYKKSAGIPTDVTEDQIRNIVLPTGWVDVKVCAVSNVWSGLKIVRRKK